MSVNEEYLLAKLYWQSLKRTGGNRRFTRNQYKYVSGEFIKSTEILMGIRIGYKAIGLWTLENEHGGIKEQMVFI